MPNWCENRLTVTGPRLYRDAFIGGFGIGADTKPHFIDRYIPMPDSIGDGWWDWAFANWGCKWSDCDTHIFANDNEETVIVFNTPWAPPIPAMLTISGMFPELTFHLTYDEPGMCFMGIDVYRNGTTLATWEVNSAGYPTMQSVEDDAWEAHMEAVETMKESGQAIITAQLNFLKVVAQNT